MKNSNVTAAQTPENLLSDLRALVSEAESMMADPTGAQAGETVTALRERFDAAQKRLGELYAGAKQKVTAGAKCTDEAIRGNPYQSIAIAAVVGLFVGVLLGRRNP